MRRESGNTAIEAILTVLVAVLILVLGFWLGTGSDENSKTTTETVTTGPSTNPPPIGSQPDPLSLAAISLATEPGRPANTAGIPGSQAAAVIVNESAKSQADASQRAAYWSSVGTMIATLREMEATASGLDTAAKAKQARTTLQALQANALFALGGLEQTRVAADPPKLRQSLIDGAKAAIGESIDQANGAQGPATATAEKAAQQLSANAAGADRDLAGMQNLYTQALEAATGGDYATANDLLGLLEQAATKLP